MNGTTIQRTVIFTLLFVALVVAFLILDAWVLFFVGIALYLFAGNPFLGPVVGGLGLAVAILVAVTPIVLQVVVIRMQEPSARSYLLRLTVVLSALYVGLIASRFLF